MYKCEHFRIEELVPPELHELLHEDKLWGMFEEDLLRGIDWMRERFGPATINNWVWGGNFKQSGLRTKNSTHYSETSTHSKGGGIDLKFRDYTSDQVRASMKEIHSPYIRRMENKVSWCHVDVKYKSGYEDIVYFFNP
jgi:hypothetical protein